MLVCLQSLCLDGTNFIFSVSGRHEISHPLSSPFVNFTLGSSHYPFGRGERHAKVADAVEMHLPPRQVPAHDMRHSIEHSRHIGFCQ